MLNKRVIPVLLMRNGGLVKGIGFKKHKYVGDPINAVKIFNDKEVDELVLLDIDATSSGRGPDFELLEMLAGECFMPVCYGGGIRSLDDVKKVFELGFEKVALQTLLFDNPGLVRKMVSKFGSQSFVASIDVKKDIFGRHKAFISSRQEVIRTSLLDLMKELQSLGVGEFLVTSIDREGSLSGIDISLVNKFTSVLDVPLIFGGGIGSLFDIEKLLSSGVDAAAVGSFFLFHGPHRAVLISYPSLDDLKKVLNG